MTQKPHLTSAHAACCWIPLFALRCEEARRPELADRPGALLSPEDPRRLWQVSPLARRAGVKPGLTVSQAIGLCPALRLCEPDPVHYDEQFTRLLTALRDVSPVIEAAELGRVFVGTDGLERLYGAPENQVAEIKTAIWRRCRRKPSWRSSAVPAAGCGAWRRARWRSRSWGARCRSRSSRRSRSSLPSPTGRCWRRRWSS